MRTAIIVGVVLVLLAIPVRAQDETAAGCAGFPTQDAAQTALDQNPDDPLGLDPDGNGVACDDPTSQSAQAVPTSTPTSTPSPTPTPTPTTSDEHNGKGGPRHRLRMHRRHHRDEKHDRRKHRDVLRDRRQDRRH